MGRWPALDASADKAVTLMEKVMSQAVCRGAFLLPISLVLTYFIKHEFYVFIFHLPYVTHWLHGYPPRAYSA